MRPGITSPTGRMTTEVHRDSGVGNPGPNACFSRMYTLSI